MIVMQMRKPNREKGYCKRQAAPRLSWKLKKFSNSNFFFLTLLDMRSYQARNELKSNAYLKDGAYYC